jgi:hypothetical protein
MAYQKLQAGRALSVIKSDVAEVPFPQLIKSSTSSSVSVGELVDSTANFTALGVQAGDIVYNTSGVAVAQVLRVVNATTLSLNLDIFTGIGESYSLYKGGENEGCVLYIGGTGDLTITTVSGDVVTLFGLPTGMFVPVQTIKVWATGTSATKIVALW